MNNNKTTNILLGILILVLIAIGVIMAVNQNRNSYRNDMNANDFPVIDNRNDTPSQGQTNGVQQTLTSSVSKNINWNTVSKAQIDSVLKTEPDVYFDKDSGVHLTQSVDLTGDGIPEGIFSGDGGNNDASTVFLSNTNGMSIAKMKRKDGTITPVYLYSIGRVMVNESYKFIPNENGFYMISKTFDENADNSESSHFICATDSVTAYQWNQKTGLFEYNNTLSAKYTAIECK